MSVPPSVEFKNQQEKRQNRNRQKLAGQEWAQTQQHREVSEAHVALTECAPIETPRPNIHLKILPLLGHVLKNAKKDNQKTIKTDEDDEAINLNH